MFKILIAEDDRELRQLFQHVLTKNGYSVVGVSNGEEALHALDGEDGRLSAGQCAAGGGHDHACHDDYRQGRL